MVINWNKNSASSLSAQDPSKFEQKCEYYRFAKTWEWRNLKGLHGHGLGLEEIPSRVSFKCAQWSKRDSDRLWKLWHGWYSVHRGINWTSKGISSCTTYKLLSMVYQCHCDILIIKWYNPQGDSGGPLVCGGVAQGIVSFSKDHTNADHLTGYTHISHYFSWIHDNMKPPTLQQYETWKGKLDQLI